MSKLIFSLILSGLLFGGGSSVWADEAAGPEEQVYGWELMSKEEMAEHRTKMRSLTTEAERAAFRKEHHEKMQLRAKEMGVELPDEPAAAGGGMGRGMGSGMGGGPMRGRE